MTTDKTDFDDGNASKETTTTLTTESSDDDGNDDGDGAKTVRNEPKIIGKQSKTTRKQLKTI